jgi:hypothetical protein
MPDNFRLAPPAKVVDGLLAVPIDIEAIEAAFVFDGNASTATADATITYTVGPTAGNPFFDLRQTITQAWLDGAPFPVAQLAHHTFGAGPFTDLRVIESVQAAGSLHTLRVQYALGVPDSQLGGSYLPVLAWDAGPRLRFAFGLSDLNRARYAEAWLPANLIFDQFSISLEVQLVNTLAAHSVLTNGVATALGANHWRIEFPERFTALSVMLEVRASDTLSLQTGSVVLPVSGRNVSIEAWKLASSGVNLATEINEIASLLSANESDYGPYLHGDRFTAFFNGSGGMEYEGATTTSSGALAHETFHSWYARGIKPASQADGWWDEGFTTFHDDGADDATPLDFTDPPIVLCSRDPWQRHTPSNAYADGSSLWRGMASLLGVASFNALMAELYGVYRGQPVSTQMLEEFLLSRSGNPGVVNAFHRFVYGLPDPAPVPDLWFRDAVGDPGADDWAGAFWDSPDLWVRNADDGGTAHQAPEYGQDNWFHARVANGAGAGLASHFVVTFHARGFAGTQFVYPGDFLPSTAAKAEFDLAPGGTRVVKARWPRALVPPPGTHTCLLASVIAQSEHPSAGKHVWEHNNLAQKNLSVVDLSPDELRLIPIVLGNGLPHLESSFELELIAPRAGSVALSLVHRRREFFGQTDLDVRELTAGAPRHLEAPGEGCDCGGHPPAPRARGGQRRLGAVAPVDPWRRFVPGWKATFRNPDAMRLRVSIPPLTQTTVALELAAPARATPAGPFKVHLVQRSLGTGRIVGGIAVAVTVRER